LTVKFEIPGKPTAKGRPRFTRSGHAYTPDATVEYENLVRLSYKIHTHGEKLNGEIKASIVAVFPVPKSDSKKKRAQKLEGTIRPTVKPDCDNIAKIVLDALNHIAYDDDSQVVSLELQKKYGEEPKTIVTLQELKPLV
jgi:Holliday junction resolvase RusA-like endonuclease